MAGNDCDSGKSISIYTYLDLWGMWKQCMAFSSWFDSVVMVIHIRSQDMRASNDIKQLTKVIVNNRLITIAR